MSGSLSSTLTSPTSSTPSTRPSWTSAWSVVTTSTVALRVRQPEVAYRGHQQRRRGRADRAHAYGAGRRRAVFGRRTQPGHGLQDVDHEGLEVRARGG